MTQFEFITEDCRITFTFLDVWTMYVGFDLFLLPPELRLKVWRFVFVGDAKQEGNNVVTLSNKFSQDQPLSSQPVKPLRLSSQILRTSSAVYKEALPILYGSHVFTANSYDVLVSAVKSFGTHAQLHIRHVGIVHHDLPRVPEASSLMRTFGAFDLGLKPENSAVLSALPSLRTVRVYIELTNYDDKNRRPFNAVPGEKFIEKLVRDQAQQGHILRNLQASFKRSQDLTWTLEVSQKRRLPNPWIWDVSEETCMTTHIHYEGEAAGEGAKERWTFSDYLSGGTQLAVLHSYR